MLKKILKFANPIICVSSSKSSQIISEVMSEVHTKCRFPNKYAYKEGGESKTMERIEVPEDKVNWETPFEGYSPSTFNALHLATAPYADPDIKDFEPKFNELDGNIDRKSHEGAYKVANGLPLNIRGRTGLAGRGILGRYGPNHAADPIVTRWKRDCQGKIATKNDKPILQFVSIQRRDTNEWAIPGGMVDPGELVSEAVRREFMEEALDSATAKNKQEIEAKLKEFFDHGKEVYKGYVDDPRNTDNAWMETVAFHFHDESGEIIGQFDLKAGDDAKALQWTDIKEDLQLYASHKEFIMLAAQNLNLVF